MLSLLDRKPASSRAKRAIGSVGACAALLMGALGSAAPAHANEDAISVESTAAASTLSSRSQVNWQIRGTSHPNERAAMSATYTTQGFVPGNRVTLQRLVSGGTWQDVSNRATASGTFSFQAPRWGGYNYRVIMRGGRGLSVVKAAGATRQIFSHRAFSFDQLRGGRVTGPAGVCKSVQFTARNTHSIVQSVRAASEYVPPRSFTVGAGAVRTFEAKIDGKWFLESGYMLLQGSVSCWRPPSLTNAKFKETSIGVTPRIVLVKNLPSGVCVLRHRISDGDIEPIEYCGK